MLHVEAFLLYYLMKNKWIIVQQLGYVITTWIYIYEININNLNNVVASSGKWVFVLYNNSYVYIAQRRKSNH